MYPYQGPPSNTYRAAPAASRYDYPYGSQSSGSTFRPDIVQDYTNSSSSRAPASLPSTYDYSSNGQSLPGRYGSTQAGIDRSHPGSGQIYSSTSTGTKTGGSHGEKVPNFDDLLSNPNIQQLLGQVQALGNPKNVIANSSETSRRYDVSDPSRSSSVADRYSSGKSSANLAGDVRQTPEWVDRSDRRAYDERSDSSSSRPFRTDLEERIAGYLDTKRDRLSADDYADKRKALPRGGDDYSSFSKGAPPREIVRDSRERNSSSYSESAPYKDRYSGAREQDYYRRNDAPAYESPSNSRNWETESKRSSEGHYSRSGQSISPKDTSRKSFDDEAIFRSTSLYSRKEGLSRDGDADYRSPALSSRSQEWPEKPKNLFPIAGHQKKKRSPSPLKEEPEHKYDTCIYLGMEEAPEEFNAIEKILGHDNENIQYVRDATGSVLELRGEGTKKVTHKPMHLYIGSARLSDMQEAEKLAQSLVSVVQEEYKEWKQAQASRNASKLTPPFAKDSGRDISARYKQDQQRRTVNPPSEAGQVSPPEYKPTPIRDLKSREGEWPEKEAIPIGVLPEDDLRLILHQKKRAQELQELVAKEAMANRIILQQKKRAEELQEMVAKEALSSITAKTKILVTGDKRIVEQVLPERVAKAPRLESPAYDEAHSRSNTPRNSQRSVSRDRSSRRSYSAERSGRNRSRSPSSPKHHRETSVSKYSKASSKDTSSHKRKDLERSRERQRSRSRSRDRPRSGERRRRRSKSPSKDRHRRSRSRSRERKYKRSDSRERRSKKSRSPERRSRRSRSPERMSRRSRSPERKSRRSRSSERKSRRSRSPERKSRRSNSAERKQKLLEEQKQREAEAELLKRYESQLQKEKQRASRAETNRREGHSERVEKELMIRKEPLRNEGKVPKKDRTLDNEDWFLYEEDQPSQSPDYDMFKDSDDESRSKPAARLHDRGDIQDRHHEERYRDRERPPSFLSSYTNESFNDIPGLGDPMVFAEKPDIFQEEQERLPDRHANIDNFENRARFMPYQNPHESETVEPAPPPMKPLRERKVFKTSPVNYLPNTLKERDYEDNPFGGMNGRDVETQGLVGDELDEAIKTRNWAAMEELVIAEEREELTDVQNVWILGDVQIYLAGQAADRYRKGPNMGILNTQTYWIGIPGLILTEVETAVQNLLVDIPPPDCIIIHVGTEDITGDESPENLGATMTSMMEKLRSTFPKCTIFWSEILEQMAEDPSADVKVAMMRSHINEMAWELTNNIEKMGIVEHEAVINLTHEELYREKGVYLNDKGAFQMMRNMSMAIIEHLDNLERMLY